MVWPCRCAGQSRRTIFFGQMRDEGWGIPQDSVLAYKWFSLACARYAVERERTITCAYLERLDTTMTAEQTAEAQALVKEWKPK